MKISSSDEVTIPGITNNNKLTFKNHADEVFKKSSQKLDALRRIKPILSKEKARLLVNAFINCQLFTLLEYGCLLLKVQLTECEKLHFRALQIVYNVHGKSCEELLAVSNDISVHQKQLRILAIEVYKSFMKTNADFMWDFCNTKFAPYDFRTSEKFYLLKVNATRYGLNYLIFRGSLLWNNLLTSIKISQTFTDFKNNLRHFENIYCTCVVLR